MDISYITMASYGVLIPKTSYPLGMYGFEYQLHYLHTHVYRQAYALRYMMRFPWPFDQISVLISQKLSPANDTCRNRAHLYLYISRYPSWGLSFVFNQNSAAAQNKESARY